MKDRQSETLEIDLLELFFLLLRKWKWLLLGLVAGSVLAGSITYLKTPEYKSESMLYILSKTTSITSMADLQIGSELSSDFAIIATSKPVLDTAIEEIKEELGISLTRANVQEMITVTNKEDSRCLIISAVSEDPELACVLANAITEATASQMASIMQTDPPTTVERAEVSKSPIDNGLKKNTAVGALAGFLIVAVLFIVPFILNDRIKTAEDVERYLETGVLAVVPLDKAQEYRNRHTKKGKPENL